MTTTPARRTRSTAPPVPTRQRASLLEVIRGLAAAVALAAIVVGAPIALYLLGGLLPIHLPAALTDVITAPDDGSLLLLALLAAGWIAWVVFAASVIVEVTSVVRGVPTPSLPGVGLSQRCAASLVAAVAVLITPAGSFAMASPVAAAPVTRTAAVPSHADAPTPRVASPTNDAARATAATHQAPRAARAVARELLTVTVHRHDTLWGLAEKHLGRGTRYPEIFDLNRGRRQADGNCLQDPDLIYPGWVLRLPADARHVGGHAPIVQQEAPVRQASASMPAPNRTPPPGSADPTPDTGEAPASDAPEQTPTPESVATTRLRLPTTPSASMVAAPTDIEAVPTSAEADLAPVPAPGLLLGLGALTFTGLVGELGRRRRRQRAVRLPGQRIPMPEGDAARTEAVASSMAAPDTADLLDRALRHLAEECARADRPLPDVRVVHAGPKALDVELGRSEFAAIPPFRALDDRHWELDPAVPLAGDGSDASQGPYPVLVAIGVSDERQMLLNLESVGTLQISGAPAEVDGVLRAMAIDLAVGASTARCFPTFAGCFHDLAAVLDPARTRLVPDPTSAERTLARRIADDVAIDRLAPHPDHDPADVVLAADPLRLAPGPYSGAVLVSPTPQVTGFALVVNDDGTARLADGPDFTAQKLAQRDYNNIVDLLATAARTPDLTSPSKVATPEEERLAVLEALPTMNLAVAASETVNGTTGCVVQVLPMDVDSGAGDTSEVADVGSAQITAPRILLLGPVTVTGATSPTVRERRRRLIELIAFLALNPGADANGIDEALWPGIRVERTTRNSTIHRARTWLGENEQGEPYIPRLRDRELTYELRPEVTCDWTDFQSLARRGLEKGTAGLPDLDEALSLVRGRPFFGIDPATYAWAEPVIQEMISAIADLAHLSSATHLELGDARGALRIATVGLSVDEQSEALYEDAVRAAGCSRDDDALARISSRRSELTEDLDE